MKAKSGFTLVEILIVVVILGILAAIVIPQFTEASTEAKTSSLVTDLQTMRSQIQLYKIQHNDQLPGSGSASFEESMTMYTTVLGALATPQAPGNNVYGPYLRKIPVNQFNNLNTVRYDGAAAGAGTHGWRFDTVTGVFQADTAEHAGL
ncbi:MAG TPA: prepilin-type N-terminal cleavage/methylation domain-containing protein [Sedimentisphaerales bacterium]|nr:prepilin-type N-terminal cleavage/methylation domain-containing protein [Sedimentisphaerales bacterium]